jgi:hypothetical protein
MYTLLLKVIEGSLEPLAEVSLVDMSESKPATPSLVLWEALLSGR